MAAAAEELVPSLPDYYQHLISAILAMEPSECLISHARACGGGSITEIVQNFLWNHCFSKHVHFYAPYLKSFLKKLITEIELDHGYVLDQLYELYAQYMTSFKDDSLGKRDARICKRISFLFPDGCSELQSCPESRVLVFLLQCSLNMLEGDTGCSIWPSSLFLSELILSHPEWFSNKSCFEIGSGVGLVGLCLAHVKASKVILSDGDLSTLANLKLNLELNNLNVETDMPQGNQDPSTVSLNLYKLSVGFCLYNPHAIHLSGFAYDTEVKCMYLPWESASESQLQDIMPDIILGADVIYDPVCLPHLVRLLTILLNRMESHNGLSPNSKHENGEHNYRDASGKSDGRCKTVYNDGSNGLVAKEAPLAYFACVIRNIETFNYFLSLGDQANLDIVDLTDSVKPVNLLRYMQSYNEAGVRLLRITCTQSG